MQMRKHLNTIESIKPNLLLNEKEKGTINQSHEMNGQDLGRADDITIQQAVTQEAGRPSDLTVRENPLTQ